MISQAINNHGVFKMADYLVDITDKFRRYVSQSGFDKEESIINSTLKKAINFGGHCQMCENTLCVRVSENIMADWIKKGWCENPVSVLSLGSKPRNIASYLEQQLKKDDERKKKKGSFFGSRESVLDYRPKGVKVHDDQKKLK